MVVSIYRLYLSVCVLYFKFYFRYFKIELLSHIGIHLNILFNSKILCVCVCVCVGGGGKCVT